VPITFPAVPSDLTSIADPRFILLAWAAGLALVAGFVSLTRVVGVGFTWLTSGTATLVSIAAAVGEGAVWARVGLLGVVLGAMIARQKIGAGLVLITAGAALLVEAGLFGGPFAAATGALALGGVTGEMMLGHWYLIDPRLPRWTLRSLAVGGIVGLALDGLLLGTAGTMPEGGATLAYWLLFFTSIVLMVAVIAALRYPAYSGVMAATGLSYLAVLTTLGAVFLGRALLAGLGPFAN
jgi:hypothetical protein